MLFTIPASIFDNTYSVVFGPGGMLYVPSRLPRETRPKGESALDGPAREDPAGDARRRSRDNPSAQGAARLATGFKNAFDLAFFPDSPNAVAGESGPEAHDEINLVEPGNHYGYPEHQGATRAPGVTPPLYDYGDDRTSPVGIVYYSGSSPPRVAWPVPHVREPGSGMYALRIDPSRPGRLLATTPIVPECTLDVIQTADGSVVFSDAGGSTASTAPVARKTGRC